MNTPDAVATPYDIQPIPYFAYTPSTLVWLLCAAAALAVLYLAIRKRRSKLARNASFVTQELERCLEKLQHEACDLKTALAGSGLLVRRFLALELDQPVHAMGRRELSALIEVSNNPHLISLAGQLLRLETATYLPEIDPGSAAQILRTLSGEFKEYVAHAHE